MTISTKRGDEGETDLQGRRVKKSSCLIQTLCTIDSLSTTLGLAKVHSKRFAPGIATIQYDLYKVMGDIYNPDPDFDPSIEWVEDMLSIWEPKVKIKDFHIPGESVESAFLDKARTDSRQTELFLWGAYERNEYKNKKVIQYINRLSDLLWVWARITAEKEDTYKKSL